MEIYHKELPCDEYIKVEPHITADKERVFVFEITDGWGVDVSETDALELAHAIIKRAKKANWDDIWGT